MRLKGFEARATSRIGRRRGIRQEQEIKSQSHLPWSTDVKGPVIKASSLGSLLIREWLTSRDDFEDHLLSVFSYLVWRIEEGVDESIRHMESVWP